MPKTIAIYGPSCSLKSDIAREISRLTGFKVRHPGEAITTKAKTEGKDSGLEVDIRYHKEIDDSTREWINTSADQTIIVESTHLGLVLNGKSDIFRVHINSNDDIRGKRWSKRKEEGGGRTRQIGENLAARDKDDAELQENLYGTTVVGEVAQIVIDSSERSAEDCAFEIWSAFEGKPIDKDLIGLTSGKPAMDKKLTKGIRPGSSSGIVRVYSVNRNPFGGYIDDETSGKPVYVHKSAVESAGLPPLEKGQHLRYKIEEDGVGGFRAVDLELVVER